MTDELMSPVAFKWMLTILTGGLAGAWFVVDSVGLVRSIGKKVDAVGHDKRFGNIMGILIGATGIIGCLRFHDVV